jgi:alginate O-acetyltransferase complex protein AlgI
VFWLLSPAWRKPYLLALSLLFYASWSPAYLPLPLVLCAVVFFCARAMEKHPGNARRFLRIGIGFTVLLLASVKYWRFLVDNVNLLSGAIGAAPLEVAAQVALPLGISFYSFEAISYLLDRVKGTRFADLALFILFWPHLIAGPIVRARELIPQFAFNRTFEYAMIVRGLDRLVWGLVQKHLIANNLALYVNDGFLPNAVQLNTTVDSWFFAAAFGLQIYFDFAAYSNMAIGAAQLFGITLPENFRYPYHAHSPADFWSRWHMTLSRWVRDYLFFPLNVRYRGARGPLYLSLIGIMALVGLWHGAGWGFVTWGLMHGLYLVSYRVWEHATQSRPRLRTALWVRMGWRFVTLAGVTVAWVPFRAATAAQAAQLLKSMFFVFNFQVSYSVNFYLVTALVASLCAAEPFVAAAIARMETAIQSRRRPWIPSPDFVRPFAYALGLFLFAIFDDRTSPFIYFQF